MIARDATDMDFRVAVRSMRDWNKREMFATRGYVPDAAGLDRLAAELVGTQAMAIASAALCHEGGAIGAIVSAYRVAPKVAAVGMVMTTAWQLIDRPAWRWLKQTFIPKVLVPNVAVAQTSVMCGAPYSLLWLFRLGFTAVGRPLPRGNDGELFLDLAWINPTIDGPGGPLSSPASRSSRAP